MKQSPPVSNASTPGLDPVQAGKRRVIKARPLEPLPPERKYVEPAAARAGLSLGLFSWVHRRTRVKVDRGCLPPDGLRAPTHQAQQQARFQGYFELRGAGKLHFPDPSREFTIHRNRVIFLGLLLAAVVYGLYWIASI